MRCDAFFRVLFAAGNARGRRTSGQGKGIQNLGFIERKSRKGREGHANAEPKHWKEAACAMGFREWAVSVFEVAEGGGIW